MVNGKKQEIQMEKGTSFENNGGIYTVDENGQLKKFDKSSNVWTDASSIEMRNYQWQAFQNVANNDGDGATYSKADIEKAMAMSGDALDTDMSNNLPSGYKIERSADEVPEGTFAVDVSNGDKKAATLKFSLAEIAELKAASQAREAGHTSSKSSTQRATKVSAEHMAILDPDGDGKFDPDDVTGFPYLPNVDEDEDFCNELSSILQTFKGQKITPDLIDKMISKLLDCVNKHEGFIVEGGDFTHSTYYPIGDMSNYYDYLSSATIDKMLEASKFSTNEDTQNLLALWDRMSDSQKDKLRDRLITPSAFMYPYSYSNYMSDPSDEISALFEENTLISEKYYERIKDVFTNVFKYVVSGNLDDGKKSGITVLNNVIDTLSENGQISDEQVTELRTILGNVTYPDGSAVSVDFYEFTFTVNIKLANGETKSFRHLQDVPKIERKDDGSFVVSCYQGDYSDGEAFEENNLYSRFIVTQDGEVDCKMRNGVLYNTRTMTDGSVVHEQVDKDTNEVYYRKTTFPDGKIVEEDFRPEGKSDASKHVKTTLADGSVISSHFDADGKEISRDAKYYDGTKIEASNGNLETARLRGGNNTYENGVCTKSDLADEFFTAIDGLSWDKSDLEACISNLTSNNIISVLCAYNSKAGEALEVAVAGEWAYGGSGSITNKINELLAPRIAQAKAQGIEIKGTTPTEIALELAQFDSQMLAEGKWAN